MDQGPIDPDTELPLSLRFLVKLGYLYDKKYS